MEIPDQSLLALSLSEEQAEETLRMAAAAKFFELGRLSLELPRTFPAFPEPSSCLDSLITAWTRSG